MLNQHSSIVILRVMAIEHILTRSKTGTVSDWLVSAETFKYYLRFVLRHAANVILHAP